MKEHETGTQSSLTRNVPNPEASEAIPDGDTQSGTEDLLSPRDFRGFSSRHQRHRFYASLPVNVHTRRSRARSVGRGRLRLQSNVPAIQPFARGIPEECERIL